MLTSSRLKRAWDDGRLANGRERLLPVNRAIYFMIYRADLIYYLVNIVYCFLKLRGVLHHLPKILKGIWKVQFDSFKWVYSFALAFCHKLRQLFLSQDSFVPYGFIQKRFCLNEVVLLEEI
jgi:hypothetical protein